MKVNNLIEATHDDLTIIFEELTSSHGVRAVAAWQALCEPDVSYALDDEEAPYEFRHAVGTDIGWKAAQEGLDPNGDIPRYVAYMRLHAALGADWPEGALRRYLQVDKGLDRLESEMVAQAMWSVAVERYEEVRESLPREEDQLEELASFGEFA